MNSVVKRVQQLILRAGILCAVWSALGVLGYTRHYLLDVGSSSVTTFWVGLPLWLVCYLCWVPLTPVVFALERRFPLESPKLLSNMAVLAGAGVVVSYAAYAFSQTFSFLLSLFGLSPNTHPNWLIPWPELAIEGAMFAMVVLAAWAIRRFRELEARRRDAAQFEIERANIEAELRKAELETLRMRINPHFLFNALQNISVLAQQDARTAGKMLTKLGDVLRTAIRPEFQAEVSISREMELTRAYLEIEKMRFGDRLEYRILLEPGTESAQVPSLLLQPLVENAIIHGLAGVRTKGRIEIRTYRADGDLVLSIIDNGVGFPTGAQQVATGVGLGSTRERLKRLYPGDEERLAIANRPEGGTEVRIRIRETIPDLLQSYDAHPSVVCR